MKLIDVCSEKYFDVAQNLMDRGENDSTTLELSEYFAFSQDIFLAFRFDLCDWPTEDASPVSLCVSASLRLF